MRKKQEIKQRLTEEKQHINAKAMNHILGKEKKNKAESFCRETLKCSSYQRKRDAFCDSRNQTLEL